MSLHIWLTKSTSPFTDYPDMDSECWQFGNRIYNIKESDTGVPVLQESPADMSSLSRRACYKCGNVGHYAG